jgi:putative endonuclease
MTSDLKKRVFEHKDGILGGFTKKYFVKKLVYFEQTPDVNSAILREKQLKKWKRDWKIKMIEESNPQWNDLYNEIV